MTFFSQIVAKGLLSQNQLTNQSIKFYPSKAVFYSSSQQCKTHKTYSHSNGGTHESAIDGTVPKLTRIMQHPPPMFTYVIPKVYAKSNVSRKEEERGLCKDIQRKLIPIFQTYPGEPARELKGIC